MKIFKATLYSCDCGYQTTSRVQACKHSKTIKCQAHSVTKKIEEFVLKEEHLAAVQGCPGTINNITGSQNIIGSNVSQVNVTINLTVPNASIVQSIYDAMKSQECIDEIKYADPHQIPAILFKYTRGTKAEKQVIKYDVAKDAVHHVDPVTGHETSKDLKKFRNEYLAEQADVYDDTYHIPYLPKTIQKNMNELATPQYENGKKKDKPIPAAEVIKICASGDHRMYKLPHDTKRFYTQVADDVDKEIKSTAKTGDITKEL